MDETALLEKAWQLASRERRVGAVEAGARALLPGAALALLLVALLVVLGQPPWEGLAPLLLVPAGAALRELLRPLSPIRAAYRADLRLGLQERLGTAVEWLLSEKPRTVMAQVLLRDAAARAAEVRPEAAFPQRWPRSLRGALLLALLASLLAWAPPVPWWSRPDAEAVASARRQVDELRRDARDLQRQDDRPELRDLEARVEALAREIQRPDLDPAEAMERISALSDELQRRRAAGAGEGLAGQAGAGRESEAEGARRLREVARLLARDPASPDARGALRQLASDPEAAEAVRAAAREALQELEQGDGEAAGATLAQGGGTPGQQGQGGPPGGDSGAQGNAWQAVQPGEDRGEGTADFGRGTTMERQEPTGEGARDFVIQRQSERTGDWTEEYRRLHPPKRDDLATADARASGRLGAGRTLPTSGEGLGAPSVGATSGLPARDTFVQARESAEEAVAREEVPASRRDLVRDYFEGIDPRH